MVKTNKSSTKPKRLSDKEMRKVLLSLKKRADKEPKEKGSFGIEVICSGKDIAKSISPLRHKK